MLMKICGRENVRQSCCAVLCAKQESGEKGLHYGITTDRYMRTQLTGTEEAGEPVKVFLGQSGDIFGKIPIKTSLLVIGRTWLIFCVRRVCVIESCSTISLLPCTTRNTPSFPTTRWSCVVSAPCLCHQSGSLFEKCVLACVVFACLCAGLAVHDCAFAAVLVRMYVLFDMRASCVCTYMVVVFVISG